MESVFKTSREVGKKCPPCSTWSIVFLAGLIECCDYDGCNGDVVAAVAAVTNGDANANKNNQRPASSGSFQQALPKPLRPQGEEHKGGQGQGGGGGGGRRKGPSDEEKAVEMSAVGGGGGGGGGLRPQGTEEKRQSEEEDEEKGEIPMNADQGLVQQQQQQEVEEGEQEEEEEEEEKVSYFPTGIRKRPPSTHHDEKVDKKGSIPQVTFVQF